MAEAGKKPHGNKKYYHVLIDINRGELFDEYIRTKLKIKPTSWIRDVVYKFLQDKIDKEVYDEALKKDQENWNRACLLYTSPSPRDLYRSRMPSSA